MEMRSRADQAQRMFCLIRKTSMHDEMVVQIGITVREQRIKARLSQAELSKSSGLHRSFISDLEQGRRNLSVRNLSRLAASLTMTASKLLRLAELRMSKKRIE
jgi:transcriptional regulator with XRE-family HTH domain